MQNRYRHLRLEVYFSEPVSVGLPYPTLPYPFSAAGPGGHVHAMRHLGRLSGL